MTTFLINNYGNFSITNASNERWRLMRLLGRKNINEVLHNWDILLINILH